MQKLIKCKSKMGSKNKYKHKQLTAPHKITAKIATVNRFILKVLETKLIYSTTKFLSGLHRIYTISGLL